MKKVLIAVDDSKCAMKAVDYTGQFFSGVNDLQLTLVHVLPNLPAIFWDEGHFLSDDEKKERKKVLDTWLARHQQKLEPIMRSAADRLIKSGIKAEQIKTKFISDSTDTAQSILEEAKDGGYQTIIIGRCGISQGKHLLLGSVTSRVIHLGTGVAICVVE
jgi:nucleotide-binding universal stress UspA family protein